MPCFLTSYLNSGAVELFAQLNNEQRPLIGNPLFGGYFALLLYPNCTVLMMGLIRHWNLIRHSPIILDIFQTRFFA